MNYPKRNYLPYISNEMKRLFFQGHSARILKQNSYNFKLCSKNQSKNCVYKDHLDKIKVPDPVGKDLISKKLWNK